jgi:hypothetical protein
MGASIALPSAVREFTVVLEIYPVLSRQLTTLDPETSPHYHSPA